MKYLNITVLLSTDLIGKIYLLLLKKHGYLPKKIINLDFSLHRGKKYNLLKKLFGLKFTNFLFTNLLKQKNFKVNQELANKFLNIYELNYNDLSFDVKTYCNEYSSISISHINDEKLIDYLSKEDNKTFLFTGGGILKKDSKFIHVHPGIVPYIKGSNGIFWSFLLRKKSGYSCFYMNEGIDTGDILYTQEYEIDKIDNISHYSNDELYHHILKFYDPLLRAKTLILLVNKSLSSNKELNQLNCIKQNPADGRTYFRMHKRLLEHTLNELKKKMDD